MRKEQNRRLLLNAAHRLESWGKQLRGAADKIIPQKRLFLLDCEQQNWQNVRPGFVLSTGRSGTLLLNNLLLLSPDAQPLHEPRPELYRPSRLAYEQLPDKAEVFREVFKSAREEYLLAAARQGKVYVETNNQITFFAPIIRDVFPRAVFIHLIRHPGDFVRSGIRRKWYTGQHSHDIGRIVPMESPLREEWAALPPIARMAWLWNETNRFIIEFLKSIPPGEQLQVMAENLFSDPQETARIYQFLQLGGYNRRKVQKLLKKPVNVQRKGQFPRYAEWPEADKELLHQYAPLARKFGYR